MAKKSDPAITIRVFHMHPEISEKEIKSRVGAIIEHLDVECDELSVAFVDDPQMREYNRNYRNIDKTTDVLSFPLGEINEEGKYNLGDIIISVEKAEKQAQELKHTLKEEIDTLLTHGILHLLGYDHEVDSGEMLERQQEVMTKLGYN